MLERPISGLSDTFAVSTGESAFCTQIPLFHASVLFGLGIVGAHAFWLRPSYVLLGLVPITLLCVASSFKAQRILWAPLAALWLLLGAWCAEMEPAPSPDSQIAQMSDGLLRTVEGTVTRATPMRDESDETADATADTGTTQRVDLHLSAIESVTDSTDQMVTGSGGIRLTIRRDIAKTEDILRCGDHVRALVRMLPPQEYRDPGAWSRRAYLLDQGISGSATVASDNIQQIGGPGKFSAACWMGSLQQRASSRMLALPARMQNWPKALRIDSDDAVMLAAMTTGDRTYLTRSLRAGFERTGSFHMLVVSGFHLAIVAGCVLWLARRRRLPQVPATLLTIAASFAFALFTGFAAPVQRSLWMVTLYLIGRLFYRNRSPLNTIGFAALCLLAASPRTLFDSSFQMTLLAVVSIAGIAAPILEHSIHPLLKSTHDLRTIALDVKLPPRIAQFRVVLRMLAARLARVTTARIGWQIFPAVVRFTFRCTELLVVSCVVELAMALPMAIYFHRITLFALPVNLIVFPLLLVLMPMALLTLLLAIAWPTMAVIPAAVAGVLLHFGVGLVHLFGSIAAGNFRVPAPLLAGQIAFYLLLSIAILLARQQNRVRHLAWVALLAAAAASVLPRPVDHPQNSLLVEAIDVGQGDSLLLITPDGKTLLMDGGGFGGGPRSAAQQFDIGEEVVAPALWARGIRHLDVVALSHAHSDHMGGLPAILADFKPDELRVGRNPSVAAYEALLDQARAQGIAVKSWRAGDTLQLGQAQISVLAPLTDYQPGPEPANNDSLVLRASYGATSVLLEGDAEAPIEDALLKEGGLPSTLLKIGHHGSVSSTQPAFLAAVAPQWALISCGLRNRYGHPRAEILAELEKSHIRTYSTDVNGAVCFSMDGKNVEVQPLCGVESGN